MDKDTKSITWAGGLSVSNSKLMGTISIEPMTPREAAVYYGRKAVALLVIILAWGALFAVQPLVAMMLLGAIVGVVLGGWAARTLFFDF